jgi:hypothetical protein
MERADFRHTVMIIQMEYVEMPGLVLTWTQAARLWTLPPHTCQAALASLVATGFLILSDKGLYGRRGTPPVQVERIDSLTWAVAPSGAQPPTRARPSNPSP